MVRIQQLKLPITHTEEQLKNKIAKILRIQPGDLLSYQIRRQSIDARKKREVAYVYTVDAAVEKEAAVLRRVKSQQISLVKEIPYQFPGEGKKELHHRPVVIGSGPAGLFCAYLLAEHGYCPLILERGKAVEGRMQDVERFWRDNVLDTKSNVQFGEGGAGTFSDGKLNTLVKDVKGRNRKVLEIFIRHGAPESIAYQNKPHIGTDILKDIIADMRRQIEEWGGTYLFETCVTGLEITQGRLSALDCEWQGSPKQDLQQERKDLFFPRGLPAGDREAFSAREGEAQNRFRIETDIAVLAIGHSARDTFGMLLENGFEMEAKSFAIGLRVEHPQAMIDEAQYGREAARLLPAASYKLTANLENGRSVYSFCMCPGGFVVNASSEEKRIAVNGMSYSRRDGINANSAIIVSVTPADFGGDSPLSGVEFQRRLEEKAYQLGNGCVPQQLFGDFEKGQLSTEYGNFILRKEPAHFGADRDFSPSEGNGNQPISSAAAAGNVSPGEGNGNQPISSTAAVSNVSPSEGNGNQPISSATAASNVSPGGGNGNPPISSATAASNVSPGEGNSNKIFSSAIKGRHCFAPLHQLFPEEITSSFIQGMHMFAHRIPGFDHPDVILSGVESRTSSPVRITRGEDFESAQKGVYPCGEGAGYAGGIMSAAMDGMKVAEAIAAKYKAMSVEHEKAMPKNGCEK